MPALPITADQIVITASRAPATQAQTPASVTILDQQRLERLDEPLLSGLLRLTPSASISTSGPAGSLTEVRIRGAEANHTLFFVDGIKLDDPASGDTSRFELLNADIASRVEVVRGPQSALWGSEAIGGVIAINGVADRAGYRSSVEGGTFGFLRASASGAVATDKSSLAGGLGWQRSTGIDSFNGLGDKDGYRNLSARLRGTWKPAAPIELGVAALALGGRTEFDGFDPLTFAHTDTLDSSRNRLRAGRLWAKFGDGSSPWTGQIGGTLLGSSNRNFLADEPTNRTRGTRRNLALQIERQFHTGALTHRLIGAAEVERETFHARGTISGLSTEQDRSRSHRSLTGEWRADAGRFTTDLAIRRDWFNRFRDATSIRASALARVGGGFSIAGSYAEGIAQPTFFDLYGFFPNDFIGNPALKPESTRGFEGSLRFARGKVAASITAYRQKLHDEIVTVFPPPAFLGTTLNLDSRSRRQGVEAEFGWKLGERLRLDANYSYLDATEPRANVRVRELRRPKHSGALAIDGASGRLSYAASLAYVGRHFDSRDVSPFDRVELGSYWLAGARVGYTIRSGIELFARGSNLLDQSYQDVFGYRTEGRALYAGIRLADRRSSP
ncbi:MAG: TonB-dependent receptor plug domain-containing protein [Sphingomicrobium sp.]